MSIGSESEYPKVVEVNLGVVLPLESSENGQALIVQSLHGGEISS